MGCKGVKALAPGARGVDGGVFVIDLKVGRVSLACFEDGDGARADKSGDGALVFVEDGDGVTDGELGGGAGNGGDGGGDCDVARPTNQEAPAGIDFIDVDLDEFWGGFLHLDVDLGRELGGGGCAERDAGCGEQGDEKQGAEEVVGGGFHGFSRQGNPCIKVIKVIKVIEVISSSVVT